MDKVTMKYHHQLSHAENLLRPVEIWREQWMMLPFDRDCLFQLNSGRKQQPEKVSKEVVIYSFPKKVSKSK